MAFALAALRLGNGSDYLQYATRSQLQIMADYTVKLHPSLE
ncbi:hypothetical protein QUB80_31215 [Chlorogloeopsis sp. ULAP01]|nr:hypothetical protein [Chlorogloeopsis sp. ULAP01]MDM9385128.1 hypothetical protein [Chlorogloeopsis sp. ULAP01]